MPQPRPFPNRLIQFPTVILWMLAVVMGLASTAAGQSAGRLQFSPLPPLPDPVGVAGPLTGAHNGAVIVAGGANFAPPDAPDLWQRPKQFHDAIRVLQTVGGDPRWRWISGITWRLSRPVAYSAVVSTSHGVLCMGGENEQGPVARVFLLSWDGHQVVEDDRIPDLPVACTAGGAAVVDDWVYLVAGLVRDDVSESTQPTNRIWRLPLAALAAAAGPDVPEAWQPVVGWPDEAGPRGHALVTAQHDGFGQRLYVIGGRRPPTGAAADGGQLEFLSDVWSLDPRSFDPGRFDAATGAYRGPDCWRRECNTPRPVSAGTAVPAGPAHIMIPAYADGSRLAQQMASGLPMSQFAHPGFPAEALTYHTGLRRWSLDAIPVNQVTTPAVRLGNDILLISGEVRPRVRTRDGWRISFATTMPRLRTPDLVVIVAYLLGVFGVGVWFTFRNRTTDDYFRGGKKVPWLVAGCSIFATMLSSITYMAIPSKAFAQNWIYLVGNFMILGVAPIAIYVALPFFRRIDATSAYEYLEKRFSRSLRLIGSGSFTLFHVFRIGIVLALAALALSRIIPLTPVQCVVVMGVLSIAYSTLGGIEAVVWTDTVQTLVLIAGALICLVVAWTGAAPGSLESAVEAGKFQMVTWDFGPLSFTTMALWVVILGSFGQNIASYTADQAVVQRYMTTSTARQAARSIWFNGLMAIPAGLLFFGLGTALWMFYLSRAEQLDPAMAPDAILPLFISQHLPTGLAGLVVAGIFAAAQSTVSTSMNSGATTIVTDFLRPLLPQWSDRKFLGTARCMTLAMGTSGMVTGLLFVNPRIQSLFDEWIQILGLFLGVLAGLFALGATSRRANAAGGLIGALSAIAVVSVVFLAARHPALAGFDLRAWLDHLPGPPVYLISGYLYAIAGILICYGVGWVASVATGGPRKSLQGLTLYDR